jgi:imidazolonepropionase-like amidohydrolase
MKALPLLIRDCIVVNSDFKDAVDLFVVNGKIKEIRDYFPDENIETDDIQIVNARGCYLLPGLIDCHVHLILDGSPNVIDYVKEGEFEKLACTARKNSLKSLESGILTLRDMGCTDFIVPKLRDKIKKGICLGPRVYATGHMISEQNGHVKQIARELNGTLNDAKKAVKEQVAGGADFIKLIISGGMLTPNSKPLDSELDDKLINIATQEAKALGLKIASHVYSSRDVGKALDIDTWTIEHGSWASRENLRKAASSGTFFIPTIKAAYNIIENADMLSNHAVKNANDVLDAARLTIPRAKKEGVCIVMGTDSGTPYNYHGDNIKELEYLSEMGLSNEELIYSATINSCKLLGKSSSLGQIKPGFIADMILIDSDPLDDIKAIRKGLKYVIKEGRIVKDPSGSYIKS